MNRINIHIMGVSEEENGKGAEIFFKQRMTKNYPHLWWEMNIQINGSQRILNRLKKSILRHYSGPKSEILKIRTKSYSLYTKEFP